MMLRRHTTLLLVTSYCLPAIFLAGLLVTGLSGCAPVRRAIPPSFPPTIAPPVIKTVVIDPGHGGKDPGTIAKSGLQEKKVVLDIAKRLKKELTKKGIKVIMTREKDEFISLWKRTYIANRANADLFISIHANANRARWLNGFEVYYLSESVSDETRALVSAENSSLHLDEASYDNSSKELRTTLWDMIYTQNRAVSKELANSILASGKKLNLKHYRLRGAPFYVLKKVQMPALLIEVAYLSNSSEAGLLNSSYFRQKAAESIAEGITNYIQEETLVSK